MRPRSRVRTPAWHRYVSPCGGVPLRSRVISTARIPTATPLTVAGMSTCAVSRVAQTCGFSGPAATPHPGLRGDSRAEQGNGTPAAWSWSSGRI